MLKTSVNLYTLIRLQSLMEVKSEVDILQLADKLRKLVVVSPVIVTIEDKKPKRTVLQNRFMFKNYQHIGQVLYDSGMTKNVFGVEQAYSQDELHEFTKKTLGVKTTRFKGTKEFGEFMERAFAFWINFTAGEFMPLENVRGYFERNGYKIDEKGNIEI